MTLNFRCNPRRRGASSRVDPLRRRFDFGGRFAASVFAAASLEAADCPDRHIVIANDLATETNAAETTGLEDVAFGDRHLLWFASNEFDSAGCAAGMAAAGV